MSCISSLLHTYANRWKVYITLYIVQTIKKTLSTSSYTTPINTSLSWLSTDFVVVAIAITLLAVGWATLCQKSTPSHSQYMLFFCSRLISLNLFPFYHYKVDKLRNCIRVVILFLFCVLGTMCVKKTGLKKKIVKY